MGTPSRPDAGHDPETPGEHALEASHAVGGYREYGGARDLAAFVQTLWVHRSSTLGPSARHRVVPEPDVSVALVLRQTGDGRPASRRLVLVGPVRTARLYAPPPGERMVAVRLKPEWCHPLLGIHPADHADAVDDFAELRPDLAGPILDDLPDRPADAVILGRLSAAVRQWAGRADPTAGTELAHRALELLRRAGPGSSIRSAAAEWDGSGRHLRRAVRSATGTSPKRLLREKRLAAALYRADRVPEPAWSRIAVACGYYDQSHLIRDCNALAGAPPGTLHRERRSQPRA